MTSVFAARPTTVRRLMPFVGLCSSFAGGVGWLLSGQAATGAVVAVGLVAVAAGAVDGRTHRIPNDLVLAAFAAVGVGALLAIAADHRSVGLVGSGVLSGCLFSGTPLLALMWIARPTAVGAGDVKMLAAEGAAIGLLAPLAAPLILLATSMVAIGQTIVLRRTRDLPLAAGLAVGYAAAVVAGLAGGRLLGGPAR